MPTEYPTFNYPVTADTYTAYATMYVLNGNPNLVNYQYANMADLNTAVQLLDTYMVVVRSSKVMTVVAERLQAKYPGINTGYISSTLSMGSVGETGVLQINCKTGNPQLFSFATDYARQLTILLSLLMAKSQECVP